MPPQQTKYVPALSFRWLTPLYDPLLKWGMREEKFKGQLVEYAQPGAGQRVLDLGCGTGTLTLMLKRAYPAAHITGIDGDPEVLAIAKAKSQQANTDITWDEGLAFDLPYASQSFDVVVSSLMIHHLVAADKVRAFRELLRVLLPRGRLHVLDFGPPFSRLTRMQAATVRHLEHAADNFAGRLLPMLQEAGFRTASAVDRQDTLFGPIWFYAATKPHDRGEDNVGH